MAKKLKEINDEEFPSNSKAERIAPIREARAMVRTEGEVIPQPKKTRRAPIGIGYQRKKTFAQSLARMFAGDEARGVVEYILNDVLIPAAKNMIQESVSSGIEMFLFGETKSRDRGRDKGKSVISYNSYYRGRDRDDDREPRRRHVNARDRFDLTEIYFKDGRVADNILSELCDTLEEYEQVTVAEYFDVAGIPGATWVHDKWGWTDLRSAHCTHTRYGWAIVLPDPEELD